MIYIIRGAPRTKKTSNRILRFGKFNKVVPSAPFIAYQNEAVPRLQALHCGLPPFSSPVHIKATFFRDKNIGDWNGYTTALADILQKAGVIKNDRLIAHWDGTRLDKDATNPRVELEIKEIRETPGEALMAVGVEVTT